MRLPGVYALADDIWSRRVSLSSTASAWEGSNWWLSPPHPMPWTRSGRIL